MHDNQKAADLLQGLNFDHWLMGVPKPEYEVAPQEEAPVRKGNVPAKQPTRP